MAAYTFFYRTASPFSNFHACQFQVHGVTFTSSEQLFMYCKARYFNDIDIANKILNVDTPKTVKALGRKVVGFNGTQWDKIKYDLMCIACYHKFSQNDKLKKSLMETKDTALVEASPTDCIWGIGMDVKHPDIENPQKWRGQNLLGKALDHVRNVLMDSSIELAPKETLDMFNTWFPKQTAKKKIIWKVQTKQEK